MVPKPKATICVQEIVVCVLLYEHLNDDCETRGSEHKSLVLSALFDLISDPDLRTRSLLDIAKAFDSGGKLTVYTCDVFSAVKIALEELVEEDALEHDIAADLRSRATNLIDDGHETADYARVRGNSFFGVFLRKCALAAEQLNFDATVRLHGQLKQLVDAWELGGTIYDDDVDMTREDSTRGSQKTGADRAVQPVISDSHARFMSAWRSGDYAGALEYLSKHFDHSQGRERKSSYQYALLNLALIQSDFGCKREALWAIYETIDAARDSKDDVCLNIALSWLSDLAAQDPSVAIGQTYLRTEDTNRYVIKRAHENSLPDVEILAYLSRPVDNTRQAFENVLRAQRVSLDIGKAPSVAQYLALHELWQDSLQPTLAKMTLVQACKTCDTEVCDDDGARLRSRMAMHLWSTDQKDAAVAYLSRDLPRKHLANASYAHIIEAQLALFRVLDDKADHTDLSFLLAQGIAGDGLQMTAAVIRAHLRHGDLVRAEDVLQQHVRPYIDTGIALEPHRRKCAYELLGAEVWAAAGQPDRALPHVVRAMHHAAKHTLRRQYQEARVLLYKLHGVAEI